MERAMSVEERIKRAEDIYNRRNGGYSRITSKVDKQPKSKKRNVKKLLMQIFVCLSIYVIFYAVTNREYVFSSEFRNEVNSFFKEKTKIAEWYSYAKGFITSKFTGENNRENAQEGFAEQQKEGENSENSNEEQKQDSKSEGDKSIENLQETKEEQKDENIGGALDNVETKVKEDKKDEQLSEQELMEKDAKEIKEKISFISF